MYSLQLLMCKDSTSINLELVERLKSNNPYNQVVTRLSRPRRQSYLARFVFYLFLTVIVNGLILNLMPFHKVLSAEIIDHSNSKKNSSTNYELRTQNSRQRRAGFTLIELLIVISIIGILAALTMASYGGAQNKAQDGVRKSDLAQVKRALELAKGDCSGSAYYPLNGGVGAAGQYSALGTYLSDVDLKYISSMPTDPKNDATYYYGYVTSATTVNRCPNPAGDGTLTIAGADDYSLFAILAQGAKDAQGVDSRNKCNGKPVPAAGTWTDATYNGYYVVCNN